METIDQTKTCACGRTFTQEQSSGSTCFKCKTSTIGFTWRGPTRASRQNFHDHTLRSALAESDANIARSGGNKDEYISGNRWV